MSYNKTDRTIAEAYGKMLCGEGRRPDEGKAERIAADRMKDGLEADGEERQDAQTGQALNDAALKVKELIGWNPVGGVCIVGGSFRPKYGGRGWNGNGFAPMTLEQFVSSAVRCCTAEAHDVVRQTADIVGSEVYLADENTFQGLVKDVMADGMTADDYPEYYMHSVALVYHGHDGSLTLMEILNDSYYGQQPFLFEDPRGRDFILSKILEAYPFLRPYADNSDRRFIGFTLPPSLSRDIEGAVAKRGQRQPSLADSEWEERNVYDKFDPRTGEYDTQYNIDVRNAYRDRYGDGDGDGKKETGGKVSESSAPYGDDDSIRDVAAWFGEWLESYEDGSETFAGDHGWILKRLLKIKDWMYAKLDEEPVEGEMSESRGFVRKLANGCSLHDLGDVFVVTDRNGRNIGQCRTETEAEGIAEEQSERWELKDGRHIPPSANLSDPEENRYWQKKYNAAKDMEEYEKLAFRFIHGGGPITKISLERLADLAEKFGNLKLSSFIRDNRESLYWGIDHPDGWDAARMRYQP